MKLAALTDKFREIYNSFKEATKQAEQLKEKKAELESELKTLKGTNSILTQALTATEKKLQVAPPFASSKNSQKPQDRSMSATASFVSSKSGKGAVFDFQEQIQQLVDEKNSKDDEVHAYCDSSPFFSPAVSYGMLLWYTFFCRSNLCASDLPRLRRSK